jgi:hypothetical protein
MNGDTPDQPPAPDTPDMARTNLLGGPIRANAVHVTVKTATVTVVVKDTGGTPLSGVEVEVTGTAKQNTGADGSTKFNAVPAGSPQNIKARKANYGPVPAGGTAFAPGEAVVTQTFTDGQVVTIPMQLQSINIKAAQANLTVVLDGSGNAPGANPILQFQISNGPANHLYDVQLSRGGAGDLTGGPGLAGSWIETDGRDARMNRTKFSSWSNGQTALQLDGSGNATFTLPLEWWRDQARQKRSTFTSFTYSFRVVAFKAGPTPLCVSSADGSASGTVTISNNLLTFQVQDLGYVNGGKTKSILMKFTVKQANTISMYTLVQWKSGGRELWSGNPPVMTRPTVQDYNVTHESNYPTQQIDRLGTNPRYHDGPTASADGLTGSADDAPSSPDPPALPPPPAPPAAPPAAPPPPPKGTASFTHIDFDSRIHLNFEVPAAVTISRQDGSAPVFGVVTGVLADPQPITLDSAPWNTRVLQTRAPDGTVALSHPDAFAGP